MANIRGGSWRGVAIGLLVGASLCAIYGVALLTTAVTGSSTPSSVLLVGFGVSLLVVSVVIFVIVILHWMPEKPSGDKS